MQDGAEGKKTHGQAELRVHIMFEYFAEHLVTVRNPHRRGRVRASPKRLPLEP